MGRAVAITDATFKAEVYESDKPVLTHFWATWCEPCKALAPILDELTRDLRGQIRVATLDVDANVASANLLGVQNLPTLILFKNGRPAARLVGLKTKDQLMESLAPHLI